MTAAQILRTQNNSEGKDGIVSRLTIFFVVQTPQENFCSILRGSLVILLTSAAWSPPLPNANPNRGQTEPLLQGQARPDVYKDSREHH